MADLTARIAALWRYPVKSCAGEAVDELVLDDGGWPVGDREWGVVDAAGELTWMGAHPRLARVQATLRPDHLQLTTAGAALAVPLTGGNEVTARGWNDARQDFDPLQAWDAGDAAAGLLQSATGTALRLVRLSLPARRRPLLNALHLLGDGSLQAWREALTPALDRLTERARPNLVLTAEDGEPLTPFIEDLIAEAQVGGLTLRRIGVCERCVMTTVDPTTGEPQPAALEALARLSQERVPGAPVQFGVYVCASGAGVLRVGDRVSVALAFS